MRNEMRERASPPMNFPERKYRPEWSTERRFPRHPPGRNRGKTGGIFRWSNRNFPRPQQNRFRNRRRLPGPGKVRDARRRTRRSARRRRERNRRRKNFVWSVFVSWRNRGNRKRPPPGAPRRRRNAADSSRDVPRRRGNHLQQHRLREFLLISKSLRSAPSSFSGTMQARKS